MSESELDFEALLKELAELRRRVRELESSDRERKRAEESLAESEKRFREVSENALEWIWEIDGRGRYVYSNPVVEQIYGYTPEEILEMHFYDLAPPDEREELRENAFDLINRKRPFREVVNRCVHKDGSEVWVLSSGVPCFDPKGRLMGYRGADMDITRLKRAEERLKIATARLNEARKMEAIGRLAGGIAHEFNNLMTNVTGFSELLGSKLGEDDPGRELVTSIHKAGLKAASITQQLLEFSRRQAPVPVAMNLNDVLGRSEGRFRPLLGESRELVLDLRADPDEILADPGQIEQIATDLIVNARDAMPEGGRVTLATGNIVLGPEAPEAEEALDPGEYIEMRVADSGAGMDAETLSRIFEPFFSTKEVGKGSGLGLPAVYGIVKQNGGDIRVESEPARGTVFRILWPGGGG